MLNVLSEVDIKTNDGLVLNVIFFTLQKENHVIFRDKHIMVSKLIHKETT